MLGLLVVLILVALSVCAAATMPAVAAVVTAGIVVAIAPRPSMRRLCRGGQVCRGYCAAAGAKTRNARAAGLRRWRRSWRRAYNRGAHFARLTVGGISASRTRREIRPANGQPPAWA